MRHERSEDVRRSCRTCRHWRYTRTAARLSGTEIDLGVCEADGVRVRADETCPYWIPIGGGVGGEKAR
jgi:hypothetical protein